MPSFKNIEQLKAEKEDYVTVTKILNNSLIMIGMTSNTV